MRRQVRDEWVALAGVIAADDPDHMSALMARHADWIGREINREGGVWDSVVDARITDLGMTDTVRAPELSLGTNRYSSVVAKSLRIAWQVLAREGHLVPASERPVVREALSRSVRFAGYVGRLPPGDPPEVLPDEVPPDGAFRVDVRFLRRVGPRRRGLATGTFPFAVTRVDAEEAPVAVVLTHDGGTRHEVRSWGGRAWRAVTEPGTMRPATEARFARAVASGEPWLDNPFVPHDREGGAVKAMTDLGAVPSTGTGKEAERDRAAEAAVLARSPDLVSINGVVHRACPVPRLHLVRSGAQGADALRLAWRVDDRLDALTDPRTVIRPRPRACWSGFDDGHVGLRCWPSLPVDRLDEATEMAEAYDVLVRSGSEGDGLASHLRDAVGVEVVRPDLLPTDGLDPWREALMREGALWAAPARVDAVLTACLRRDAGAVSDLAAAVRADLAAVRADAVARMLPPPDGLLPVVLEVFVRELSPVDETLLEFVL